MKKIPNTKSRFVRFGFKGLSEIKSAELTDPVYATSAYNFAFDDGCLTSGIGVDLAQGCSRAHLPDAPAEIKDIFYYRFCSEDGSRDDRLVARLEDDSIWYVKLFEASPQWRSVTSLKIRGDSVQAINYNNDDHFRLLFCSKDSPLFILEDSTALYCPDAPSFSCFEIHSERLFGGVNGARPRLWFSDDFDPFNWRVSAEEAGYISFEDSLGDIVAVISFLGYLYIFREYSIFRLSAFGKQSDFELKKVYIDSERIVKNSVVRCGGKIFFLAGDKLYDFDGFTVRRVARNLPKLASNEGLAAAYLNGCYYLACAIDDGEKNNAVLRYDLSRESLSVLKGAEVHALATVKSGGYERVYAALGGEYAASLGCLSSSGCIMEQATHKTYFYSPSTLGTGRVKTVSRVEVVTDGRIKLALDIDGVVHDFDVKASGGVQRLPVGAKGRMIGLSVESDEPYVTIPPITVVLEVHSS